MSSPKLQFRVWPETHKKASPEIPHYSTPPPTVPDGWNSYFKQKTQGPEGLEIYPVREDKRRQGRGGGGGVRLLSSEQGLDCSTSDVFPTEKTNTAWRREERKVGGEEPSCLRHGLHRGLSMQYFFPLDSLRPGQLQPQQTKVQVLTAQQLNK